MRAICLGGVKKHSWSPPPPTAHDHQASFCLSPLAKLLSCIGLFIPPDPQYLKVLRRKMRVATHGVRTFLYERNSPTPLNGKHCVRLAPPGHWECRFPYTCGSCRCSQEFLFTGAADPGLGTDELLRWDTDIVPPQETYSVASLPRQFLSF